VYRLSLMALALAILMVASACAGGAEEGSTTSAPEAPVSSAPVPTPTSEPAGGGGGELGPATVVPVPRMTPQPIPEDWATYTDPVGPFTFKYPVDWRPLPGGGIYSWDITTWNKPWFPPNGIKLEMYVSPISQAEPQPAQAEDGSLGGVSGWEIVYLYDPSKANGIARVHQIAVERGGYRFSLVAYFGPENQNEDTFAKIVQSFSFTK